jgi:hypothetical protein
MNTSIWKLDRFYEKMYISCIYKSSDAIFIMTKTLKKYFKKKIRRNSKLLLKKSESAFLAEPDNSEAFTEKLDSVLFHPDLAREVDQNGREIALKHYN